MNYDECVAWMGRYCAAKHAAPRLREKLAEETRRAEYAEVLRKAPAGTAETNLESAIASINARREKLAAQLTAGEAAQVEIEEAIGKAGARGPAGAVHQWTHQSSDRGTDESERALCTQAAPERNFANFKISSA